MPGTFAQPQAVVQYSQLGSSWTTIENKLINYDITLRELAAGMSQGTLTFADPDNALIGTFPTFGKELGLHWHIRVQTNDRYLLNGRIAKIKPSIGEKDLVSVEMRCYGQELLKKFINKDYTQDPKKADDLIEDMLTILKMGDVLYSSPHTASLPILTPDYRDKCPFAHDVIREIGEQVDYAAFVQTQSAVTKGTLLFFPKDDSSKRHTTLLKNVLFSSANNIVEADMPRSADEICNWMFLLGRQANAEPPGGDEWTEDVNLKGWYSADGGITQVALFTDGCARGTYCVGGQTMAKSGPHFKLSIPDVLGDVFDCAARKGSSLNFFFMVSHGMDLPYALTRVAPIVILEDSSGNRIQHLLFNPLWYDVPSKTWRSEGIPIGSNDYIHYREPGEKPTGQAIWFFYDGKLGRTGRPGVDVFDWDKIRFIEFEDICDTRLVSMSTSLLIDGLYFGQAYQAAYEVKDEYSGGKYGWAMQKPMKTEFTSGAALKAYGDELIRGTCKPTLLLNLAANIDQGAESFYPGYSIQVDIPRWGTNPGQPWWRILEVHYSLDPFHTKFQLIPSTVI